MPAEHVNNPHGNKRPKTDLACDTCRRRKQRCDGKRPACAHCELAGFSCSYRPTPTSLETDVSVLTRLAQAEARIELLEQERSNRNEPSTRDAHNQLQVSTDDSRIPDLHTAAGHKILQYWPRLRVKLTLDLEPLTFLKVADEEDTYLTGLVLGAEQEFELLPIIRSLENLYDNLLDLPLSLIDLLKISQYFFKEHILEPLYEGRGEHQTMLDLRYCSIEFLLLQTVAVRSAVTEAADSALPSSETCFKLALESFWKLQSKSDDSVIPLTLCFAHIHLYFFPRIWKGRRWFTAGYIIFQKELDGVPSASSLQPITVIPPLSSGHGAVSGSTHDYAIHSELFLRVILNKVLGGLYTANEAYITPEEAGPVISSVSIKLDTWYQSLPLEM
ncbi:hypothetical protein L207DRAFT_535128 [Hyaloscypha variabilis F]|uniref:Zn(2)-C6 fungal-type domain-containing protein n=1 Tax=Hyaloscypha variabilis (strain UAMH 11265 / GT02V1 / F) TaxID=1149755 RepID=A0A2J6R5T5_HYAVF|nr:hypothetical protein L207DRAFT_535128 [Hyaloscypha variabilis F]